MEWWDWTILISSCIAAACAVIVLIVQWTNRPTIKLHSIPYTVLSPRLRLENSGSAAARDMEIHLVGCTTERGGTSQRIRSIAAGQVEECKLAESVEEAAFALISYSHPNNRYLRILTWSPVQKEGFLAEEYRRQVSLPQLRHLLSGLRNGKAVGPFARLQASLPRSPQAQAKAFRRLMDRHKKHAAKVQKLRAGELSE